MMKIYINDENPQGLLRTFMIMMVMSILDDDDENP